MVLGEDIARLAHIGSDRELREVRDGVEVFLVGAEGHNRGEAVVVFGANGVGAIAADGGAREGDPVLVDGVGFADIVEGGDDVLGIFAVGVPVAITLGEDADEGKSVFPDGDGRPEADFEVLAIAFADAGRLTNAMEEDDDGIFFGGFVGDRDEHPVLTDMHAAGEGTEHEAFAAVLADEGACIGGDSPWGSTAVAGKADGENETGESGSEKAVHPGISSVKRYHERRFFPHGSCINRKSVRFPFYRGAGGRALASVCAKEKARPEIGRASFRFAFA